MSAIFRNHIEKFITVNDSDFDKILSFFEVRTIAKKQNLLEEGQICKSNYFVLKGLIRKFFTTEKGTEQTTEFAIETWWMTDNMSYEHKTPSEFYIQAVEKSELLQISSEAQERLLEEFPALEKYFRIVYQRAVAASQNRVKYIFSFSKEEFYLSLLKKQPAFVQRVPQYLIASFLGFTPEYLSELRKKIVS
ncbi:MAG: Crp/Fnr family transcriptional regulator [Chryseobacterium sp.]|nr:MAG: Crp/Fnr family transcriptional regulator [Chryseobacterium sp.]